MTRYVSGWPVMLRVQGRKVVVIGDNPSVWDRATTLAHYGARVRVIFTGARSEVPWSEVRTAQIDVHFRPFQPADLDDAWLVVTTLGPGPENVRIYREARTRRVLCYAMDDPEHSDFILPAVAQCGPITITVSTSGASPHMAQVLRDRLAATITERDQRLVEFLGKIRSIVHTRLHRFSARRRLYRAVVASDIPDLLVAGREREAWQRVHTLIEHFVRGEARHAAHG